MDKICSRNRRDSVTRHMTQQAWAVILAGGDGTRLRSLTRRITGEDRPKQFCPLYGGRTLLAQTRSRLAPAIAPERTLFTLVKAHEEFYAAELADVEPSRMVVQPANKGTTAAIIYSLQRIGSLAGDPIVAFFPTDHHYSRESRFVASVRLALRIASNLDAIILLGARAEHPETDYGWIEPGMHLECPITNSLRHVHRFWEKPSTEIAHALHARDCLWNTFVMIGRTSVFTNILEATVPQVLRVMATDRCRPDAPPRFEYIDRAHKEITSGDFSKQVLSASAQQLAVLRLGDVGWSDLGTPERVRLAMTRYGLRHPQRGSIANENIEDFADTSAI